MAFSADILSYHPKDRRSTNALMQSFIENLRHGGYEPNNVRTYDRLDGVQFARTDFEKAEDSGGLVRWTYEAIFVRACDTKEFVFIFVGSNQMSVKKLIGETGVKLDFAISGCGSKGEDVSKE